MQTVHCYKRLSHKFAPGWVHLDPTEYVGTMVLTPQQEVEAPGLDHSDGGVFVQYGRLPAGVPFKEVAQALRDTLAGSGCRHEHDCCGCRSTSVRIKRYGSRQVQVRTRVTYNY